MPNFKLYKTIGFVIILASFTLLMSPTWLTAASHAAVSASQLSYVPYRVSDIATGTQGSFPHSVIRFNGMTYFGASNGVSFGLWASDGTANGTWLVKDLGDSGYAGTIRTAVIFNNLIYFLVNADNFSADLWRSDGTTAGTMLVANEVARDNELELILFNDQLFFQGYDNATGGELWHSDGTTAGTKRFADLVPGNPSSDPDRFVIWNDLLFFSTYSQTTDSYQLWRTDGTLEGTILLNDNIDLHHSTSFFAKLDNALALQANGLGSNELWRTDGTVNGTYLVKEIGIDTYITFESNMIAIDNILYFQGQDEAGSELWRSDGTTNGTYRLKDIEAGSQGSYPEYLTNVDGTLYFRATTAVHGTELWRSDGTEAGTKLVSDIFPGSDSSSPHNLIAYNNKLYFGLGDPYFWSVAATTGLWESDGTEAGTKRLSNAMLQLDRALVLDDLLFFRGATAAAGEELWQSDGTAVNTQLIKDINTQPEHSHPYGFTPFNNDLFFFAHRYAGDFPQIWKTDGTDSGTQLVHMVNEPIFFNELVVGGDKLYFAYEQTLWQSDGTMSGTAVFQTLDNNASFDRLIGTSDALYLSIYAHDGTYQLWHSDGTQHGTQQLGTLEDFVEPILLNNQLYFVENDKLWRSDGTVSGTVPLFDNPSFGGYWQLIPLQNHILIENYSGLWSFDLTTNTVQPLLKTTPDFNIDLYDVAQIGNDLYFSACCTNGTQLWKTDGTPAGTTPIATVNTITMQWSAYIGPTVVLNDKLYFIYHDQVNLEQQLWRSDGTAAGTFNMTANKGNLQIAELASVGEHLYFVGNDGQNGWELWQNDGTPDSMIRLTDRLSDERAVGGLTDVNGQLFFVNDGDQNGQELWSLRSPNFTKQLYLPLVPHR